MQTGEANRSEHKHFSIQNTAAQMRIHGMVHHPVQIFRRICKLLEALYAKQFDIQWNLRSVDT